MPDNLCWFYVPLSFQTHSKEKAYHFIQQTGQLLSSSKFLGREEGSVSECPGLTHPPKGPAACGISSAQHGSFNAHFCFCVSASLDIPFEAKLSLFFGLLWWFRWLRICLQCKRPRFDPWVGKTP